MIGLDTNVLVRLLTGDDPVQAEAARHFVSRHGTEAGSLRVETAVLLELVWTLKRAYGYTRKHQVIALQGLLAEPCFTVADRPAVEKALVLFAKTSADFADCLIAIQNAEAGCVHTYTFDTDAARAAGMKLVPANS